MDAFEKQLLLLVEDSPDDVFLTQRALEKAEVPNPVQVVSDGQEAIAYLKGEGPFSDRAKYPLPIVVLLDLNMPRISGEELYRRVQASCKGAPIVLSSGADEPRLEESARAWQAVGFLHKPFSLGALANAVRHALDE